jgi:hypothetical protein
VIRFELAVVVSILLVSASLAQQDGASPPEAIVLRVRVLEASRSQCETALADMWAQATRLEGQLKEAQAALKRLEKKEEDGALAQ